MSAVSIVQQYYDAFNNKNWQGMLDLVSEDIVHEPNEGDPRHGKSLFTAFVQKMDVAYDETLRDFTSYTEPSGEKVAVQFTVHGRYLQAEEGLPEAHGQTYILPAAAFLSVKDGLITQVTTYYNLSEWIRQVSR
jgi:steroid delta-isomerase-like uncharacterized protein